jgi:hypothetical protein
MNYRLRCSATIFFAASACCAMATNISNLNNWTLVEDPFDPGMTGMVDSHSQATLMAVGSIPSGTDIGFQSVDEVDVANSTNGYYFSPTNDFTVAIDFDLTAVDSMGAGGIGFGVGEDGDGTDSAGVGLGIINGLPTLLATAGRTNDADLPIQFFSSAPMGFGRFFVRYTSATGDITLGVSGTPGAGMADETKVFATVQNDWDDEPLLLSFFLRSQAIDSLSIPGIPPLSGTSVTAVFSNLEVLDGEPIGVIPEPSALMLVTTMASCLILSHRRKLST